MIAVSIDIPIMNTLLAVQVPGYGDDMNFNSTVVFGGNLMVSVNGNDIVGGSLTGTTVITTVRATGDTNAP